MLFITRMINKLRKMIMKSKSTLHTVSLILFKTMKR